MIPRFFVALVMLITVGHGRADEKSPELRIPVKFEAPGKGFVSLSLVDKDGIHVRTLLSAAAVERGEQAIPWDGTTDLGVPVVAGSYSAKAIFFTTPPSLDFVMKVGKSGTPPWPTADGKGSWGGNLGGPAGICSNGKSIVMVWSCVEDHATTGVQQMDADGNIQLRYSTFYPWDVRSAAAMDEKNLYLGILRDLQALEIAEYKLGEPRGKILVKLPSAMVKTASGRWKPRPMNSLDGLAITADRIFASVGVNHELFVIERSTGTILKKVTLPSPRGLAATRNGLLVVSADRVLKYTFDGEPAGVLVDQGTLKAPNAMCVGADGTILVGDSGRFDADPEYEGGSKQVYAFDGAGKLLRKMGKAGGAPRSGVFDPSAFGDIAGLCFSPDGRTFFVNETATGFNRTSRWSLDGKLEKEWFGRKLEVWSDAINPQRPHETVKVGGPFDDSLTFQAWHMDYEKKASRPAWRYTMPFARCWQDDVVLGYGHGGCPLKDEDGKAVQSWPLFGYGAEGGLRTFKGRNYALSTEGAVYSYGPDQPPKLVAMVFPHRCEMQGAKIKTFYDQGPNTWFTWADANGDGRVQVDETLLAKEPALLADTRRMWGMFLDDRLNVVVQRLTKPDPVTGQAVVVSRLPLKEMRADGVPVYDWNMLEAIKPALVQPSFIGGDGLKKARSVLTSNLIDTPDSLYTITVPECDKPLKLPGIDGDGWWAGRNWRKKIARFDKSSGRCLWAVGRRAPGVAAPGQMYNPISLAGFADDAVFAADAMAVVWVWDKEGLYLGRLYNGPDNHAQDSNSMYIEMQSANVVSTGGKTYLVANDTGVSVHELKLPARRRFSAPPVHLSAEQARQARPWDPDGVMPTEKPTYMAQYLPAHPVHSPMKINGDFDGREGWHGFSDGTKVGEMLVLLDGERLASVRALYDDKSLYLAYSVRASNGPINAGTELPICPFVSGAYLDASFGPDWSQPQRTDVRDGDLRVLLARVKGGDGRPIDFQQGYWQKKKGGERPQTISSPAASVRFDQIQEIPGLQMAFKVHGKENDTDRIRYDVEVAIPLAAIGLANPGGKKIGFDLSIGVANASGDRRERAGHWGGLSEAAVVDRPGSAQLIPHTWGTLLFAPAK